MAISSQKQEVIDMMKNYELRKVFCENIEHRCNIIREKMAQVYDKALGESEIADLEKQKNIAKGYILLTEAAFSILDETEKKAIYRFYIHRAPGHVNTLCEELSCEERQVYKYKDRALDKLCLSIFGFCDNI